MLEHEQPVKPADSALTDKARSHIFSGDVDTKYGKSQGWHYERSADRSKGTYVIEGTRSAPDQHGIYKAKVVIAGVEKKDISSFFPKEWSQEQVETAVLEAYANRQPTKSVRYEGFSKSGVKIEMWLDAKGAILTAYPKYGEGK